MGDTVKRAVAPVANAANKAVSGVKDIAHGNVAKGIGEVGAGYVDAVKGAYGVTSDNKFIGAEVGKTALAEFSSNPSKFVASGVEAYASGGASLVDSAGAAGMSMLSSAMASTPSQLAGGAPQLPGDKTISVPYLPSGGASDFTMPLILAAGGFLLYKTMRR